MNQRVTVAETSVVSVQSQYFPFIDGLRAISILSVVLYHVGMPGFAGGFVGVDVFFVISGFLIINHILAEVENGRFGLWEFYARRALRILPAFAVVLLTSAVIANIVLYTPTEFKEFGRQLLWSALMVVNHHYFDHQGYFEVASDLKPLLNMWSLAVEEQFYLIAPLVIAACASRKKLAYAAVMIGLLSFVTCVLGTTMEDNPSFFLAPFRAWEFIAGGASAFLAKRLSSARPAALEWLAALGLVAIVYSTLTFDPSSRFPGWRAAVPVLGAAVLISVGLVRPVSVATRILAAAPMVWIGLVSYSWYLWHWPILSFARISRLGERDLFSDSVAAVLSLLLAACTYLLVERPIRTNRKRIMARLGKKGAVGAGALASVALLIAAASVLYVSRPLAAREYAKLMINRLDDDALDNSPCLLRGPGEIPAACATEFINSPYGILMGDSHAKASYQSVIDATMAGGGRLAAIIEIGCVPVVTPGIYATFDRGEGCGARYRRAIDGIITSAGKPPKFVLLKAHWYGTQDLFPEDTWNNLSKELDKTISHLRSIGVANIILVGPSPQFRHPVPDCIMRQAADCDLALSEHREQAAPIKLVLDVLSRHQNVRYVDPTESLCFGDICPAQMDGSLLYYDAHHLSLDGEKRLSRQLAPAVLNALAE